MTYTVMACMVMAYSHGLYSDGLHSAVDRVLALALPVVVHRQREVQYIVMAAGIQVRPI